jgi:diguanylate cyclase (GGDEF)-like protein
MGCLIVLRLLEFRTGELVPWVVDPLELAAMGAVLLSAGDLDPVLGPIFFLLLFRALTGPVPRMLAVIAGYVVVTLGGALALGVAPMPGAYVGMAVVPLLGYGIRILLERLRDERRRHRRMLGEVLDRLPMPVVVTGEDGGVVFANPAAQALTGPIDAVLARATDGTSVDLLGLAPGETGLELLINDSAHVVVDTVPTPHGTVMTMLDVTARHDYERRLEHAALHDPLTGLANRALLWQRFAAVTGPYAVLLVDLDGFKMVNDTRGHQAGDEVLCRVAERLREACDQDATVARLAGDEFAVLLPGARARQATAAAEVVRGIFTTEITVAAGPVWVGGSIGYALGGPGRTPDEVLAGAYAALYASKHGRRAVPRR